MDSGSGGALSDTRISVNGLDVTGAFHSTASKSTLIGLMTGLRPGRNEIIVSRGNSVLGRMTLVNYPITGPVISGPHERPYVCDTERFRLPSGNTLGAALDENCSAKVRVEYVYRSTSGGNLKPLLQVSGALPADVARIRISEGSTVPYIVRVEVGTINRSIYQILMLHDPTNEPTPDFRTHSAGWNRRLLYRFSGGCAGGWYRQGVPQATPSTTDLEEDGILSHGYAVASASLNVFGNNCNDLLAAETMMMVKERFIEAYGSPLFTIGWGGSGGAMQAYQIADNYPGLVDGIIPSSSYPDANIYPGLFATRLMYHYFQNTSASWSEQDQLSATGLPSIESLRVQGSMLPDLANPTGECNPAIPHGLLYDPVHNPRGARCTIYDHMVNVYGRDANGFARRLLDNVGVQYGLKALNGGKITKAQFLDLNEKIGGIDMDANFIMQRTTADPLAIRIAYESGRVLNGGGGLSSTPIIDYRDYRDPATGDQHMRSMSFATHERLLKANGHADNQVMLVDNDPRRRDAPLFSVTTPSLREALRQMDAWLTNLRNDTSRDSALTKVRRAKPSDLTDACFDLDGTKIVEKQTHDSPGRCNLLYPVHATPNLVAGMPLTNDVLKCQLKPIDRRDYVAFTPEEMTRLRRIFPNGVCCDFSRTLTHLGG
jgi:hypothetical protein